MSPLYRQFNAFRSHHLLHSLGDGKSFPRNPRSEEMLAELAKELVKADSDR